MQIETAWSQAPSNGSIPPVERLSRILVIDGAATISTRIKSALPSTSYELTLKSGADRVARVLEEVDPDLLIVDRQPCRSLRRSRCAASSARPTSGAGSPSSS